MKQPKTYNVGGVEYALINDKLVPIEKVGAIKKVSSVDYSTFTKTLTNFTGKEWIKETGFIDKKNPLDIDRELVKGLFSKFNVQYKGEPVKRQSIPYRLKIDRLAKIQKERKVSKKTAQSQKKMAISQLNARIKVANNSFISTHLEKALAYAKETL